MNSIMRMLAEENRDQRGLTGQGRPGLYKLLGGSVLEADATQQTILGSRNNVGTYSLVDPAYVDQRLRGGVSSGGGNNGPTPPRCVALSMFVVERDRGVMRAGNVLVGDWLLRGNGTFGRVVYSQPKSAEGVRLITEDSSFLKCSTTAPIQSSDGFRLAPEMQGRITPQWSGGHRTDMIVTEVAKIGTIMVQHITLEGDVDDDHVFLASGDGRSWWAHHNAKEIET